MLRVTLFKERLNLVKELKSTTDGERLFQTGATRGTKNSYGNYEYNVLALLYNGDL